MQTWFQKLVKKLLRLQYHRDELPASWVAACVVLPFENLQQCGRYTALKILINVDEKAFRIKTTRNATLNEAKSAVPVPFDLFLIA